MGGSGTSWVRAEPHGCVLAPVRTRTPAGPVAEVVLPAATHAVAVGHDTEPSEATELATGSGVQVVPPSAVTRSTPVPLLGVPNVAAVVPTTTQSPPGRECGCVDGAGAVVVDEVGAPTDDEVDAGAVVLDGAVVDGAVLDGAVVDGAVLDGAGAVVADGSEPVLLPAEEVAPATQAMPPRMPVPVGTAAVGAHVLPPSPDASTDPVAWSGPEDA